MKQMNKPLDKKNKNIKMKDLIFGGTMKKNNFNINLKNKNEGRNILFLSLTLAIFGVFGNANAQEQNALDTEELVDITTPSDVEYVPSASPLAVDELQQNINRPTLPHLNARERQEQQKNESTYFQKTSLDQARLTALRLENAIDKALMDGERERMKFLEEGGVMPGTQTGLENPSMMNPNIPQQNPQNPQSTAPQVEEEEEVFIKPRLRGVYSYADTTYAEMLVDGRRTLAEIGTVLADGSKVTKINPMEVTVNYKGESHRIPLEGGSLSEQ